MRPKNTGSLCTTDLRNFCAAAASVMTAAPVVGLTGIPAVFTALLVVGGLYLMMRL